MGTIIAMTRCGRAARIPLYNIKRGKYKVKKKHVDKSIKLHVYC
jgi:hypothetical protein